MSKKVKIIIFLVIIISLIIAVIFGVNTYIYKDKENQKNTIETFFSYVNEQKYEEMYEMLSETSKSNISKEDFVKRNQKRTQKVEH